MYTWSPYPFIRITFYFVLGILTHHFIDYTINSNWLIGVIFSLFIAYLIIKVIFKNQNFLLGNLGMVLIVLSGYVNAIYHDQSNNSNHLLHNKHKISGYAAQINSSVIEKEKYFIYDAISKKALFGDSIVELTGTIKLYLRRQINDTSILKYGDKILIKKSPFRLPPPGNPNEFNYMKYMAGQNIYFQQFVDTKDIKIISNNTSNPILAWAYKYRNFFSNKIDNYIFNLHEGAIAKALILGVKDGLDNKIKSSYASAGAMHVLAVSGLHAGIIHLILQWLFRPLIKRKYWKYILPIVSIICLWCFAMITGLSPSIMRAVTMFSIIIIGNHFFSKPNIFNSLSLSAFILLIYNPNFLFSVGFQLSYIAVGGIVYLFPLIYNLITCDSKLLDQVWSITAVSIAAQIATFPLTVYYFHQFPTYFLISNLIVIPAAFIIMSIGIALLASPSFFLSDFLGFILETLISWLNSFVFYIQALDMSLIEWLYINEIQTIAIYMLIFTFLMLIYYRKLVFMKLMCICSLIISISGCQNIYKQFYDQKLIFYDIKGQSIVDKVDGFNTRLSSVNMVGNIELVKYQIDPFRLAHNLGPVEQIDINELRTSDQFHDVKVLYWNNLKFIFISKELVELKASTPITCDVLVISNDSVKKLAKIGSLFRFKEIIIDGTNNYFTRKNIVSEASSLKIKCSVIAETGAVEFNNY
jgi:competence protein ComEC